MNEVPDSSLGRLGVLTQHPPSASQNHHCTHSDSTPVFPTVAEDNEEIIPKLLKNLK